jgi:hypothetical protein
MEKGDPKVTSPIKPTKSSNMTQEESEEIHNQLSKLENQGNELRDNSITRDDLINTQRKLYNMEYNMK